MFEVLAWCSAIQAGWRRHTWAPLLGSPQDDGVIHMRIVATPVEPLLVEPPPWWLPTQEDSLSDISQFVEMPTQVSPKYDINFDQLWSDAVSSSHAFIVAGRPYHHHHHWGRPLIETHLRQIERPLTTPDLGLAGHLGRLTACRRGRVRAGGWRQLDPFLDRELRGGWGSGAMHGMHPASISTRAVETQGGARAAAVVHGVVVDRRSVGAGFRAAVHPPWRSIPASSSPSSLAVAHALPSVLSCMPSWLDIWINISKQSALFSVVDGGLSSMVPRTRKSGKAVLAGRVGWRPELLGHGDGHWRRRPLAVKGRGEDEMKRGGRGRRRAHGEAQGLEKRHWEQIWSSAARRPRPPPPRCGHPGSYTVATFKREVCTHFLFYKKRCTRSSTVPLKNCRVSWLLNKFIHEIDAAV